MRAGVTGTTATAGGAAGSVGLAVFVGGEITTLALATGTARAAGAVSALDCAGDVRGRLALSAAKADRLSTAQIIANAITDFNGCSPWA